MLPPFFPGLPGSTELDLTLTFAPLMAGLIVVLSLLALGLAMYGWGCYLINAPLRKAVYPRRFVCPVKHQVVEAKFVAWKGQPWHVLDVERCSGWCLGTEKDCNKECIKVFDDPAPAPPVLLL